VAFSGVSAGFQRDALLLHCLQSVTTLRLYLVALVKRFRAPFDRLQSINCRGPSGHDCTQMSIQNYGFFGEKGKKKKRKKEKEKCAE
jgi:hypothetical protein